MSMSKFLHFLSRNRSSQTLNLLPRFGRANRFHSSCYMRSARRTDVPLSVDKAQSSHSHSHSHSRSWSSYIIPTAVLGGIGGIVLLFHYNDEKRAILIGKGVNLEKRNAEGPIIGGPFTLIDTEGRLVTERNLLGNWVLLYFGYTSSPDIGPAEVQKMAKAIRILEMKQNCKVLPVFVTIDPQRDTPLHLRAYLREFDSRILGLTGPATATRQMAQEYRVFYRKVEEEGDDYLVESSHNMYLLNPNMEVARCFGVEYSGEQLSEAILKELKKEGM